MSNKKQIPLETKRKLIRLAEKLPKSEQKNFLRRITERLEDLAWENQNTIVFSLVGYAIGELLDNTLLFHLPIPFFDIAWSLTGDNASEIGGLFGLFFGMFRDSEEIKRRRDLEKQVSTIIFEELKLAMKNS